MNADQNHLVVTGGDGSPIRVHPRSSAVQTLPVPVPRGVSIATRLATSADLPFLDQLQKQHSKALGFFPRAQMEGYVAGGHVMVAEAADFGSGIGDFGSNGVQSEINNPKSKIGYVISRDRYLKRDELGVIYQLCVVRGEQRKLVGASLIKSVFERSAYGCRLYCCWCAQDLHANHFWESLGFVPIAFRAGSTGKRRVHIFWQRRTVEGDGTPWWYPSQTSGGAIRADRLVFPIPPGTHWTDVKPPETPRDGQPRLAAPVERRAARTKPAAVPVMDATCAAAGGLRFAPPAPPAPAKQPRQPREKPAQPKIDPKYVAAARELRDRYLEQVHERVMLPAAGGKYNVSRALPSVGRTEPDGGATPLLPAA